MAESRPDPERLLAQAQREESRAGRGRLKIFLGMAPGVGKTYAMLSAAHRMAAEGHDVVIGVAETHGRTETEQMLLGLDIIPQRQLEYRGVKLRELDLDAALSRKPEILIVDELAHTNAPGSRFEKRWQDVQELLDAGIHVFSTLNIQHVETLNDVVAQITGVKVHETVPDSVVELADEIELVDLPPDALIERLKAGKVYVPESVGHAIESFFRRSNLAALRELALRHAAEWVERRMHEYKSEQGVRVVWPAVDRIMVCVSPAPSSADMVRAAKRMAAGLRADLIAAYIETPRTARLRHADRERVLETLRLAESLGAETTILNSPARHRDAASELVAYARTRNVTQIVLGKTGRSRLRTALFGSFMDEVIRRSGEMHVHVIRGDADKDVPERLLRRRGAHSGGVPVAAWGEGGIRWMQHVGALAIVAAATAIAMVVDRPPDLSEVSMIYVVGVLMIAWRFGRRPSVVAAVASALAFNYFFTEPRYSFLISDPKYVITFVTLLITGLLVGSLASRMRDQAENSRQRERRTSLLYSMSRELMGTADRQHAGQISAKHLSDTFDADVAIIGRFSGDAAHFDLLATQGLPDWLNDRERGVARWSYDHGQVAGLGTTSLPGAAGRYLPLTTHEGKFGVLALRPRDPAALTATPQLLLLEAFADQIAVALERVTLRDAQQRAEVDAERERLRSALLSSVSHDLRTPLAGIAGSASTLLADDLALDPRLRRELTQGIVDEAQRLNDLIGNLMFATRLESGIEIRKEWTTIEEIVGTGLARHREALARRPFKTVIPRDLPMIRGDPAMLSQVLFNLVDNALRYTDDGTPIEISAWRTDNTVIVSVADQGSGLEPAEFGKVFERLYRGRAARQGSRGGMGLGLTIAEGIVKIHGGRIWVEPNKPHGAVFLVALPVELPQPNVPRDFEGAAAPASDAALSDAEIASRQIPNP
ncbi:MAG: sensor histidine kinase KdpD [Planctomycetes bacterium]|nr:sensor histidine kinase KdpD [Planctomycetota bacterium]